MKKFVCFLMIFMLIAFTGCNNSSGNNSESSLPLSNVTDESTGEVVNVAGTLNPPFYKVTDENTGAVVYMMGTMHVGKPDTSYPKSIYNALDECGTLAVEVDIVELENDTAELMDSMKVALCPTGTTTADYMGEDYEAIKNKFVEKELYNELYNLYMPWMWSSVWANEMAAKFGFDSELGTDITLLNYAKEKGYSCESIETAKEQYQVNADMSVELQVYSLKQTVELSDDETKAQFEELYNAWKISDTDALYRLATEESEVPEEFVEEYEKYYNNMYTNRQKKMANYILDKLKSGEKVFVAVGAMHYCAPPSILDFLSENGYSVETLSIQDKAA